MIWSNEWCRDEIWCTAAFFKRSRSQLFNVISILPNHTQTCILMIITNHSSFSMLPHYELRKNLMAQKFGEMMMFPRKYSGITIWCSDWGISPKPLLLSYHPYSWFCIKLQNFFISMRKTSKLDRWAAFFLVLQHKPYFISVATPYDGRAHVSHFKVNIRLPILDRGLVATKA